MDPGTRRWLLSLSTFCRHWRMCRPCDLLLSGIPCPGESWWVLIHPTESWSSFQLSQQDKPSQRDRLHGQQSMFGWKKKFTPSEREIYTIEREKEPTYLLGRFCFACRRDFLVSFGRMVLLAIKTTWREENFFSSSRTTRVWIFCHAFNCGGGTRIRIAFFCFSVGPTSISRAPQMCSSRRWVLRSEFSSKSRIAWKTHRWTGNVHSWDTYLGHLSLKLFNLLTCRFHQLGRGREHGGKQPEMDWRDGRSQKREKQRKEGCRCKFQIRFRLLWVQVAPSVGSWKSHILSFSQLFTSWHKIKTLGKNLFLGVKFLFRTFSSAKERDTGKIWDRKCKSITYKIVWVWDTTFSLLF